MKITENVHLEKSGQYFRLVEKNEKGRDINVREFGTVYQALQAIIEYDYDLDGDLLQQFEILIEWIDKSKEDIKRQFRVEVKTT